MTFMAGISEKNDVHCGHTHGDDDKPLVVHDTYLIEHSLCVEIVQILRNDTCTEPHCEDQEEVEGLPEQQSLLGKGVCTQDGVSESPDSTEKSDIESVGISIPEHIAVEHLSKSFELNVFREKDDLGILYSLSSAYGRGYGIKERIETTDSEHCQKRIADYLED